ncbi:transposase [Ornithinibacillus sp. 179-J 7C1 HS]|uniref:transposase n=1 Tax=Ornithinibacillus sp. 179-J 7C1 HS TaxID=3142384 RepID=UPI0039A02573
MPRSSRKQSRSGIYHVMMRGINRQTIFEDNEDRIVFLETLAKYRDVCDFKVFAYCLMDNHVHLLLKEPEGERLSDFIKRISSSYVYWYNQKYDRIGHLFQERYKSESVESRRYFYTVLRYIHQNPVKAGLVEDVFGCEWTSVNEYIHRVYVIDTEYVLPLISENRKQAVNRYIEFMKQPEETECLDESVIVRVKDEQLISYMKEQGIEISKLQQMNKADRNAILAELKTLQGVSIRQLSRLTGISKSVIQRA